MASAVGVMVPLTCGHKVRARDRRMGYAYGISYRVHVEGLDPAASADEEPVVLRHRVYPTARDAGGARYTLSLLTVLARAVRLARALAAAAAMVLGALLISRSFSCQSLRILICNCM